MAEDPLEALRDCVENKRHIKVLNDKICLGGRSFPMSTVTTFPIKRVKGRCKNFKGRKFYFLEEICFYVLSRSLSDADYIKKAQEKNIKCVQKLDRKHLLNLIFANSKRKLRSANEKPNMKSTSISAVNACNEGRVCVSPENTETRRRDPQTDETVSESGRQKSHVRTYSRKRSSHDMGPLLRRQSQDQFSEMDSAGCESDLSDELALARNENINLERTLKSVSSFLQDHLGVTYEQLKAIEECESNTVELSIIASQVKNNIVHANVLTNHEPSNRMSFGNSKYCYKAVKHPIRGWEMVKEDLSSVLLGYDCSKHCAELEDHQSTSLEESLAKGTVLLKRAFSILISQMREFNKPLKSQEESDLFYKKIVRECLSNSVDCFRDIFTSLVSPENIDKCSEDIERWVDVSRAELGKLFCSLALTLQSLRDIPATQQKTPTSLFHFPEPTFSLALNPAKVTHSVVLDMYVHIGLAELRRIIMLILNNEHPSTSFAPDFPNGIANNNYEHPNILKMNPETLHHPTPSFSDSSDQSMNSQSGFSSSQECQKMQSPEFENRSITGHNLLDEVLFRRNGLPRSHASRHSISSSGRSAKTECGEYKKFKDSLGNTLVSSFKKQIQEKIQASNLPPGSNTY